MTLTGDCGHVSQTSKGETCFEEIEEREWTILLNGENCHDSVSSKINESQWTSILLMEESTDFVSSGEITELVWHELLIEELASVSENEGYSQISEVQWTSLLSIELATSSNGTKVTLDTYMLII